MQKCTNKIRFRYIHLIKNEYLKPLITENKKLICGYNVDYCLSNFIQQPTLDNV